MAAERQGRGARIRVHRIEQGLSQRELADKVGVSQQAVVKWEHGGDLRPEHLARLAKALGLAPLELLRPSVGAPSCAFTAVVTCNHWMAWTGLPLHWACWAEYHQLHALGLGSGLLLAVLALVAAVRGAVAGRHPERGAMGQGAAPEAATGPRLRSGAGGRRAGLETMP